VTHSAHPRISVPSFLISVRSRICWMDNRNNIAFINSMNVSHSAFLFGQHYWIVIVSYTSHVGTRLLHQTCIHNNSSWHCSIFFPLFLKSRLLVVYEEREIWKLKGRKLSRLIYMKVAPGNFGEIFTCFVSLWKKKNVKALNHHFKSWWITFNQAIELHPETIKNASMSCTVALGDMFLH